nr:hypothetical protein [Tanacetum cinerariifolium]
SRKSAARQEVKNDVSSLRYIALPNWVHDALLESFSSKPQDNCRTNVPKSSRNFNPTATSTNPPTNQLETLTVETPIPTVSLPVLTACFTDSLEPSNESNGVEADVSNMETTITASPTPTLRIHKDHPKSQIISPVDTPIQTRNKSKEISDAFQDPSWVEAMQEELLQFKIQNVWTLIDCPKGVRPVGTKWILKNKKDERGIVIRNKARLEAQGHTQEEGIDYDEVFTPVSRIESIRLFLAYASFMGFTPPGFQDPEFLEKVYKVEKAMYGLHQAPRAWHQVMPKECHLHAVKRIFRYLKGHPKLGLWLISWKCKKQTIVDTSTTEAEYVTAASCCRQVLWIQNQLLDYGRARIAQSSTLPPVANEHASPLRDVSKGKACPTDSGFGVDQDRANISKTSTLPHESAPRVTSPAAVKGSMQQTLNELMAFCTSLQRQHSELISKFEAQELEINRLKARVKLLEDREGVDAERSRDDAPIKGRNLDEREAASNLEEMENVLTSMDAATVLASRVAEVPIGSGSIPTASPPAAEVPTRSDVIPTAGLIFSTATMVTPYTRRKGKETLVESETLKKKKIQEQMDIQMARQLEEEMERDA